MSKLKEILNEASTWSLGLPSLVIGTMTLLDADHANDVAAAVTKAGENYLSTGSVLESLGWLAAGVLGIFMRGR